MIYYPQVSDVYTCFIQLYTRGHTVIYQVESGHQWNVINPASDGKASYVCISCV